MHEHTHAHTHTHTNKHPNTKMSDWFDLGDVTNVKRRVFVCVPKLTNRPDVSSMSMYIWE